ncbi:phosphoribosylamine--glycine ligase [Calditrichota bacterium]
MKVLVIGSGGREHTLVWKIAQSPLVEKVFCAPGNPGIGEWAENVNISASDLDGLLQFAKNKNIDLTVVGPEDPLVAGIVDKFEKEGFKIFGPNKSAAQLEGSKSFAKNLMKKYKIPTAAHEKFTTSVDALISLKFIQKFPVVLKASGLAAGKGVLICKNLQETAAGTNLIMKDKAFGDAGNEMVIEEFLEGEEVSVFAMVDGEHYILLSPSQDHKRVFDNDQGKNTGGMGAYSPAPIATKELMDEIEDSIIKPTVKAMISEGHPYKGLLYFGIMVTEDGPKVLEYNCRFGDPETEVVLPLLESDLIPLMMASIVGTLKDEIVKIKEGFAVDVVLASGGYPDSYEKGKVIEGLNNLDSDILVFHAGTKMDGSKLVTNGGRVLNIVVLGNEFRTTQQKVYDVVQKIEFEKMHYRKDIGHRALNSL